MSNPLSLLKALADESRLRMTHILQGRELTVGEIGAVLGLGQSRTSRHLKILAEAGVCENRGAGPYSLYRTTRTEPAAGIVAAVLGAINGDPLHAADASAADAALVSRDASAGRFFDALSGDWDRMARDLLGDFDLAAALEARFKSAAPIGVAVDLGCGPGLMLPMLARIAARVVGVDASPRMLELARRRLGGPTGPTLRMGRLEQLPLASAEINAALFCLVLHHLPDPDAAIREAHRTLKPGGLLVVADLAAHQHEALRIRHGDLTLGFSRDEIARRFATGGFQAPFIETHSVNHGLGLFIASARKADSST